MILTNSNFESMYTWCRLDIFHGVDCKYNFQPDERYLQHLRNNMPTIQARNAQTRGGPNTERSRPTSFPTLWVKVFGSRVATGIISWAHKPWYAIETAHSSDEFQPAKVNNKSSFDLRLESEKPRIHIVEITCDYPGEPENGKTFPQADSYAVGDSVTFECSSGYVLKGFTSASCTESGKFSTDVPTCRRNPVRGSCTYEGAN